MERSFGPSLYASAGGLTVKEKYVKVWLASEGFCALLQNNISSSLLNKCPNLEWKTTAKMLQIGFFQIMPRKP